MTIFSDHSDLETLTHVVRQNAGKPLASRYGMSQQFWATPARPATSPLVETLEIALATPQLVNLIQFDLARYPHDASMEYQDETGAWGPLLDNTGSPVSLIVHKSVPHILPPPSAMAGVKHPQHAFMGHWESLQIHVRPVRVQKLRLKLRRVNSDACPVDTFGKKVDYSLAVRLFALGYRVGSSTDVPRTLPTDTEGYYESFSATNDVLSSNVSMGLRQLDAVNVLGEGESDLVWRCEAQPDPNCVVSLYADVRDPEGNPQVIDRIFIDPLNNGAHITAYYATDDPQVGFVSPSDPLKSNEVDTTGNAVVDSTGLRLGTSESIILDNTHFNYNTSRPWWVGMVVNPSYGVDAPPTTSNPIFDCGVWALTLTDQGVSLDLANGDFMDLALVYQSGVPIAIVVGYDGAQQLQLWASSDTDTNGVVIAPSSPLPNSAVEKIALGSDLARSVFGQVDFLDLAIKEEAPLADPSVYRVDPRAFCIVAEFPADEPDTSHRNAVLRFDPQSPLISNAYPWGLFGGYPSKYEAMEWTPITRDYTMQRGWMELPPIRASYWKLEFTHLQATYADVYEPITTVVKRFPSTVLTEYRQRIASSSSTMDDLGLAQQESLSTYSAYDDAPSVVSTGGTGLGYTNTEVYAAQDTTTAERLYQRSGEPWSYVPWQAQQSAPRFPKRQVHAYQEEIVTRTAKVGYVVGLRRINFARQSFSTQNDLAQFEEMFYDTVNFSSISWLFDEDLQGITSGNADLVTATSATFVTNRDVRGVQFAAQQSPARRILDDSEFDDPLHTNWTASGDAVVGDLIDSSAFGTLLPVSRTARSGTWGDAVGNYPTWGDFVAASPPATYGSLSTKLGKTPSGADGLQSIAVSQPQGGYLYAAARVVADEDLRAPLWLQIYDSVTERVLAEEPYVVRKGQICEWFSTYRIGTGLVSGGTVTWGDLSGHTTPTLQSFFDDFNRPDGSTVGNLVSGQAWQSYWLTYDDARPAIASNQAQVTAAYPDQTAVVDTDTPWGSLTIKLGSTYAPVATGDAARRPIVFLGGFVFMSDNSIQDSLTGRRILSAPAIAAGDTLRFDFKPTSLLTATENPASIPAELRSYAIAVYQNNTYLGSVITSRPIQTVRGISGPAGMTFDLFQWAPRTDVAVPTQPLYQQLPSMAYDSDAVTFTSDPVTGDFVVSTSLGEQYVLSPSSTFTILADSGSNTSNTWQANAGMTFSLQFEAPSVEGILAGTLNVTPSSSDPTTWYALLLDDTGTSQLRVRADGALVQSTNGLADLVLKTDVWGLSGALLNDDFQVVMTRREKLPASVLSSFAVPPGDSQVIVFMVEDNVRSVYSGNGIFSTTARGVFANDTSWLNHPSWSPVLGPVSAIVAGGYTWGDVDGDDTKTWGDLQHVLDQVVMNPVKARLVQKTTSLDSWYVDALDLFFDPIVWEVTNNGEEWVPAAEIRNNPNGAVLFPPKKTGDVANKFAYRVTAFAPNAWVSNLVIRPWYQGYMRYQPVKPPQPHGPNLNPLDHYAEVSDDPHWMVWHEPVPREWYFVFRQLLPNIVPPKSKLPMITERISIHG